MTLTATDKSGGWLATHIRFSLVGTSPSGKTSLWNVYAEAGTYLGEVKWFGRWRKYSFYPAPDCVFEQTCLRELAEFIEARTREQRTGI